MKERRKYKRVRKFFAVNIVAAYFGSQEVRFDTDPAAPKFCDESGVDYSIDGIRIICSKPLPVNCETEMNLLLVNGDGLHNVQARGVVKWFKGVESKHGKYYIGGLQLSDISKDDRQILEELWKKHLGE
jgi:hypothetical protein